MKVIKFIILGLLAAACAHVDTVKVPQDCDVVAGSGNQVSIVCPHKISVKH